MSRLFLTTTMLLVGGAQAAPLPEAAGIDGSSEAGLVDSPAPAEPSEATSSLAAERSAPATPDAGASRGPEVASPSPDAERFSLDLTIHDVGLGLGHSRHIDGLRLNFRDEAPFVVHGVNVTLWRPTEGPSGDVVGLAVGLPYTGAERLRGIGVGGALEFHQDLWGLGAGFGVGSGNGLHGIVVGVLGAGTGGDIDGFAFGGLGLGAGGGLHGIMLGGLGGGAGGDVDGIAIGGLGFGAGGHLRGLAIGGFGLGAGGDVDGIVGGGLGVGSGRHLRGIAVGGLAVGSGDGITGFAFALAGVGSGGDLRGLMIGGIGVGCGGTIAGLAVGGVGVGAPTVRGVIVGAAGGGADVAGLALTPAYFTVNPGGELHGVAVAAFNHIRGEQHGVAIGVVNYADSLHGVQIGLINWAGNNETLKLLPVINAHFD